MFLLRKPFLVITCWISTLTQEVPTSSAFLFRQFPSRPNLPHEILFHVFRRAWRSGHEFGTRALPNCGRARYQREAGEDVLSLLEPHVKVLWREIHQSSKTLTFGTSAGPGTGYCSLLCVCYELPSSVPHTGTDTVYRSKTSTPALIGSPCRQCFATCHLRFR